MTQGEASTGRTRTFEFTAYTGAQVEKLAAFATQEGMPMVELGGEILITPSYLRLLSDEICGTTQPGDVAVAMLDALATRIKRSASVQQKGKLLYVVVPTLGLYGGERGTPIGATGMPEEEIDITAQQLLSQSGSPFPFVVTRPEAKSDVVREITPLIPNALTLYGYVRAQELHRHRLHGAVGRVLNVLNVAAGLPSLGEQASRVLPGDRITPHDLAVILKRSGFTAAQTKLLSDKISATLEYQLLNGKPADHGEVIVDEVTCTKPTLAQPSFITGWNGLLVRTVPRLVGSYQGVSNVVEFLEQFENRYQEWQAQTQD